MLVRFSGRAWRTTNALGFWLLAAGCSVVVGELPEPLPQSGGPVAGAGGSDAAGAPGGGAESMGGVPAMGGTPSGQAGDSMAHAGEGSGNTGNGGTGGVGDPCDADADGFVSDSDECGGDDCDDTDKRVKPGQTEYFAERQPNIGFDYDCSGGPELEQAAPIKCAALVACSTDMGFLDSLPACGEVGSYGECIKDGLACVSQVIDDQHVMRCH